MTTMNLRTREENGSTIITCNSYTSKDTLKTFLVNRIKDIAEIFDNVFEFPFKDEFEIVINDYEGIMLMFLQPSSKNHKYYLFDGEVRYLCIMDGKEVLFRNKDVTITNHSLEDENNTMVLVDFINYLAGLKEIIPFNFEPNLICINLRIFNDNYSKIIIEDEDIILALPNFYKETLHKLSLNIISKKGFRIIGSIDCVFNELGADNFNYRGNVTVNTYSEYDKEYGIKALELFKKYVKESKEEVNKDIFIACKPDDEDALKLALSGGGTLFYEGEVPKSDPLNFIGKVKNVKVYRIGGFNE